jgi:hypothetical protein
VSTTHHKHDCRKRNSNARQHDSTSKTIDQPPNAQTEQRADQSRPKVDTSKDDAIDLKIPEQRFSDQTETLRAARKRSDHRECCDKDVYPTVIKG